MKYALACAGILFLGGVSIAASKELVVEERHPRSLLGPEAKALAATIRAASEHLPFGGIERAYVQVETRGNYYFVGWGPNNVNVRDGGVSFHVDAKSFKITCTEIDGKEGQRCR